MTIEEKAKAYDKALEWMRKVYPTLTGADKEDAEYYFPEVAESDDERIIRAIIDALYSHTNSINLLSSRGYQMEDIEAWFEKQKEASKAIEAVERIDKYIDERLVNAHDMEDSNPDKKYYRGWDDALGKMAGILQDVYSEEKKKEQKPLEYLPKEKVYDIMSKLTELSCSKLISFNSEEYKKINEITCDVRSLLDYPIEQKSIEWNEEDEALYTAFMCEVVNEKMNPTVEQIKWLRGIRDRLQSLRPQPKQEWSEEDEVMRDNILRLLICVVGTVECASNPSLSTSYPAYQKEIDWLKSLHSQKRAEGNY